MNSPSFLSLQPHHTHTQIDSIYKRNRMHKIKLKINLQFVFQAFCTLALLPQLTQYYILVASHAHPNRLNFYFFKIAFYFITFFPITFFLRIRLLNTNALYSSSLSLHMQLTLAHTLTRLESTITFASERYRFCVFFFCVRAQHSKDSTKI